ncbi:MAG: InlB B-repeat-containing protein [Clostridia bacterium]|nr:InlB B-repeat-containing protein [Clostridia bacterium]
MKKVLSIIALIAVLVLSVACFASCLGGNDGDENKGGDKVTVSWYQGSKLLKEENITKGSKVTTWTPDAVEGKTFDGWYSEASCTIAFDFDKAINEDVDIFAKFKSDEHVEDTNEYYLIGTGAGDMKASAWSHTAPDALKLVKKDVAGANVYEITIKMYAGDRFQICYGSWDGQQGIGIFEGAAYADGINPNKPAEGQVTAADKKYAEVKNADGEVVFIGGDENNNSFKNWNAILNEGHDGIYKFTLTTYPNAGDYNKVTFELVEAIEPMTETHDMHFIGTFNEWATEYEEGELALAPSEDKATWSGFITITEDDYADWALDEEGNTCAALKLYNVVDGKYYGDGEENILLTAGTYAVKYTVEGNKVEVEKCDYYIVGTLLDAEGNAVNYAVKEGVSPALVAGEDGTYSVDFVAYDATGCNDYSWMTQQGKTDANGVAAIISIKVVYGSSLGIKDWYSAEGGDNWYLSAGTYTVTLANGAVTVVAAE